ncbi:MAG: hypothetical protein QNJ30_16790 [Kiloniellales bacterium]|nr:hypothetical protein [Kiloniellales bacterium]
MAMQSFRAISALVLGLSLSSGLAAEEPAQDAIPSRMQTGTNI